MALFSNTTKRLITINTGSAAIQVKPGNNPSVELSDAVLKIPFVQHLIKSGALLEVAPRKIDVTPVTDDTGDTDDDELAQLQAEALSIGMEFKDTWALSTLKAKLAKFKRDAADNAE